MPSAKKVAWAQMRVGIVAVIAMVILAVLVFLITGQGSFFAHKVMLYTYMSDAAALTKGTAVRINGITVGSVKLVELNPKPADLRQAVKVTMEVEEPSLLQIPVDSIATITNENALGNKYINIRKGEAKETVQANGTVKSKDTSSFDDVVASGYSVMNSAQELLVRIDRLLGIVESGQGSIGKAINDPEFYDNLVKVTAEAAKITTAINSGQGTIGKLLYDPALHDQMLATMGRVNTLIDGLQQGQGTLGKLLKDTSLHDDLRKTLGEFNTLLVDLNAGKGTAGKMLKDDALHQQLLTTMTKLDGILDKVNSGQGTLGQLLVNPQVYESMHGVTTELQGLLKDFRANPKKFLSIKLNLF